MHCVGHSTRRRDSIRAVTGCVLLGVLLTPLGARAQEPTRLNTPPTWECRPRGLSPDRSPYFARAELVRYGDFQYDDANTAGQIAYSLTNLRVGLRGRAFAEGWVRNAFDTRYVPIAFAYNPGLAPSGFIGESGAPRTFGVRAGLSF